MTLRARLALLAAVAVAVAVVAVSLVAYRASQTQQRDALDETLVSQAEDAARRAALVADLGRGFRPPTHGIVAPEGLAQVIDARGAAVAPAGQAALPIDDDDLAVAAGEQGRSLRDVQVDGESMRMVTVPVERLPFQRTMGRGPAVPPGTIGDTQLALQLASTLEPLDESLRGLRVTLLVVTFLGVAGAGLAGLAISRRALAPVRGLTEAAEHVAATQELAAEIPVDRDDEIGRLAESLNAMLSALDQSRSQQHRLVTDAGHELRTPLTALRTNIELLQRADELPDGERREVVDATVVELEELSALVAELIDLATDAQRGAGAWEQVDLPDVVEQVAGRYRRRRPGPVTVDVGADLAAVTGDPMLLDRAVANLIDNAAKWSEPDEPVAVAVLGGPEAGVTVDVRDHGSGIPAELRDRVFDRFYRAPGAQDRPGSGLGLAIVDQIVEAHGGTVHIGDPDDGPGVIVGFTLPGSGGGEGPV